MTRLLLWRHGRTEWNASGRVQGQSDVELDETGVAQAAQAAPSLAGYGPDLLVSSDLGRARRTAAALARLTGLDVRLDPRLRERGYGPWEGLNHDEIRGRYPADYARWGTPAPITNPEIESLDDLAKRMAEALLEVSDRVGTGTAVVVTHGAAARAGVEALLGWPRDVTQKLGVLGNCHFSELRHTAERGWQLRAHNLRG